VLCFSQICKGQINIVPHSWLITVFVTRVTRRRSLIKQELLILPEHPRFVFMSSHYMSSHLSCSCCGIRYDCIVLFVFTLTCFLAGLYLYIHTHLYPTRFPYHMMFVSLSNISTDSTCGGETA
jgi:hypothetical protein